MTGCERVIVVNRVAIPVEAPDRFLVVPWGEVDRVDGQRFTVDAESAAAIVAQFNKDRARMLVDFEHHSVGGEFSAPDGKVVAAGWIDALEVVPGDGIYGLVEWTPAAAAHIANKEYRYSSPTVWVRNKDGKALALVSVALTNTPAIVGMRPLVNKQSGDDAGKEKVMNPELLKVLGLSEAADEKAVIEAVNAQRDQLAALRGVRIGVCKALGVAETADDAALLTACTAKAAPVRPDPNEFVPASKHDALAAELATLKQERQQEKAGEFVANAIKAGKITADDGEMWTESFLANSQKATERMAKLPVRFAPDGTMLANASRGPAASRETDPILANADRFDPARLDEHRRILAAAKDKNVSYVEAMKLVGAM